MIVMKRLLTSLLFCLLVPAYALAETAEDAPKFTGEIVEPTIPIKQLAHLVIPLKKEELVSLAGVWLDLAQSKTQQIADRQVALLRDPQTATDTAYEEIARMIEARASIFERFSMVIDALESKGGRSKIR